MYLVLFGEEIFAWPKIEIDVKAMSLYSLILIYEIVF